MAAHCNTSQSHHHTSQCSLFAENWGNLYISHLAMFKLLAFKRVYLISFPHIFSPQEPHNVFLLVKKLRSWLAETSQDLLDVTEFGGGDISLYEPVPSTLSPLSVSFQYFTTNQVLAICIQWCPDFQIGWATRICTELVGSALKSGIYMWTVAKLQCGQLHSVWLIPLADLEVTPFFHCPARVWHRNTAPDCPKGGGYISRERVVAAVSEHSSFERWLEEKFCIKHNWLYWFIPAVPLCIKMSRAWNKFFIAEAWEE